MKSLLRWWKVNERKFLDLAISIFAVVVFSHYAATKPANHLQKAVLKSSGDTSVNVLKNHLDREKYSLGMLLPLTCQLRVKEIIMKVKNIACILFVIVVGVAYSALPPQEDLERVLEGKIIQDNFMDEDIPPDIPLRYRNSLREYEFFIRKHGCTTNEFVQALMIAATNGAYSLEWTEDQKNTIAARALTALSEMNRPDVTNFVRIVNADGRKHFRYMDFSTPFIYTNLEPEVLDYMRTQCVRTNLYQKLASYVMDDMIETLSTMPPGLQPAATNRVAQYFYFSIGNASWGNAVQNEIFMEFMPSYSNSLQRLSMMRHVAATATNKNDRVYAQDVVKLLSSQPTNTLHNLSWLVQ